ncbi:MAG TPA: TatD family hydrolase [Acidimicrobiales bacterium]|nr:TatD family hydrolase [Acidimicrobiales bacterium]
MRWIDDHCHLELDPVRSDEQVRAAAEAGVERMISVGCDVAQSAGYVDAARRYPGVVWATAGVHPHDASKGIGGLEALLAEREVVAVGECGLDFHYDHSPRDVQREVFAAQIAMAHAHDLALVIHTREAWAETFDVLAAEGTPPRTVFHCFTGGPDEARRCLDLGAVLSFSGIVTFPSATDLQEAARLCPLERLLVETDAPYLAPVPHRGKRNAPAWVPLVGEAIAELRGIDPAVVAEATWVTAEDTYRLV